MPTTSSCPARASIALAIHQFATAILNVEEPRPRGEREFGDLVPFEPLDQPIADAQPPPAECWRLITRKRVTGSVEHAPACVVFKLEEGCDRTETDNREGLTMFPVPRLRALVFASILAVPVSLALAGPAMAESTTTDSQVVLTGQVVVARGETVGDVVIFNGPVTIEGAVRGSLTSFNGDVSISGRVTGDVTSFNGTVTVSDGARVGGNLVTQSAPDVASGATIQGSQRRVNTELALGRIGWISRVAVWIAVAVSTLVFGVLLLWFAPRAAEAVAATALERVGASIGWGFALFFGIPIISVIALVTVVGIPFGLGILLGLALIYTLGYTASSYALGRALVKPPTSRFLAFLAGWAILRVVSIVPFLGGLVSLAAVVYGLGILAVAARGVQRREVTAQPAPPPPALMTPPPS